MKALNTLKKTHKIRQYLVVGILGISFWNLAPLNAQEQTATIQGLVKDQAEHPVDLATVSLLKAADSSYVRSAYADEKGTYTIPADKDGKYILVASMMGYRKSYQPIIVSTEQKKVAAPDLVLHTEAQSLGEVTITAQLPPVQRKDGALVVNVENSSLAAGNTALDILQRSPGVSVDKDGNISLMGRQGVTVMIDGKQTYLSADQLANLLRSMEGSNIQSIELNTNPSAKYDAAGTAGIINIKLKKNKMEGTNGNISLSGGYGKSHKTNNSLQINHKAGKMNVFANYSYTNNRFIRDLTLYRTIGQGESGRVFDQALHMNNRRASHNARVGIDYQTSERNTISVLASGFFLNGTDQLESNNAISGINRPVDSLLTTLNNGKNRYNNISFNVNNTFNIDTSGRKLVAEIDVSRFNDKTTHYYDNYFYNAAGNVLRDPEFILNDMPSVIDIQIAKIDYTHPFSKVSKLELGAKYGSVKSDNDMAFLLRNNDNWNNDAGRSNHFIYTERVTAAYAIYNHQLNNTEVKVGLRMEHTYSDGNSITMNTRNKRDYFNLFPNVSINQKISDNHQVGISYSRRINRPNYGNLNPFLYYVDPYSYEQGNPFLNPSFTNAYELTYTLFKRYNITAGYQQTNDMVGEVMYQNDETNVLLLTQENIAKERVYSLNLNIPLSAGKVWTSNTNINNFYMGYKADIANAPIDFGKFAVQVNSTHTFNVTETFNVETTAQYQSPLRWSIYQIGTSWGIDLGLNKSFWNKKAQIKLAVTDIFNTKPNTVHTDYANLNVRIFNQYESRVGRITFTYKFGNQKLKTSQRNLGSSEKNRVGK